MTSKNKDLKKKGLIALLLTLSFGLVGCSEDPTPTSTEPTTSEPTPSEDVHVVSIKIKENTGLTTFFTMGDEFSVANGILYVNYSDFTRDEVALETSMIKNVPDMSQAQSDYEVKVEYQNVQTSYHIVIIDPSTREDVTLTISYKYKGSTTVITDETQELSFGFGNEYSFSLAVSKEGASDYIGYEFASRGCDHRTFTTEKPTAIGEYEYRAILDNENYEYNGVYKVINFKIYDGKPEETLPIVDDATDLANVAHKYQTGKSYDKIGATNETNKTYGTSSLGLRVNSNSSVDDADYFFTLKTDTAVKKDLITVKFFVKGLGSYHLYIQLYSDAALTKRANRAPGQTKGDVSTNQTASYHFTATDAGNDWIMYEYNNYDASALEDGVMFVRISVAEKFDATAFYYLDGVEVK